MIKTHNTAILTDKQGINNVSFEVNWSPEDKDSIKVELAGKVSFISKDDLWNMVFSIVEADKQQKMVPVQKKEFEKYIKQHTVILQKDLKKGDTMAVNCEVNVRAEVAEALRRDIETEQKETEKLSPYLQKGLDV